MSTARDIITGALRLINAYASGENISAADGKDGLLALNDMNESWGLERLMVFAKTKHTLTLEPGKSFYTFGKAGDVETPRPNKIEFATYLDETAASPFEQGLTIVLSDQEWSALSVKNLSGSQPTHVFLETTYPQAKLHLWPVPAQAGKVNLDLWAPLESFASLNAEVTLPPGYARALRYNLAIELAPEYGKQVTAEVARIADESKSQIKAFNIKPEYFVSDAPSVGRGYNLLTDGYD